MASDYTRLGQHLGAGSELLSVSGWAHRRRHAGQSSSSHVPQSGEPQVGGR